MANPTIHPFHVADISAAGELLCAEDYSYDSVERLPGGADLIAFFAGWLWREPQEFVAPLPGSLMRMRWRQTGGCSGIATLRTKDGTLLQLSLLLGGEADDAVHLDIVQRHLLSELHDTGIEPAFDLTSQTTRPLLVSLCLQAPAETSEKWLFALADRCLAAAFFRKSDMDKRVESAF